MDKGYGWKSEISEYKDSISGVTVKRLTNYHAHHFHTYFTNNGWYDGETKLLIGSDRGNVTNLYSLEMESGEMKQLTNFSKEDVASIQGTYINPQINEAYFTCNETIICLNLETLEERKIFSSPRGYHFSNLSCTSDGKKLLFGLSEDLYDRIDSNLAGGYVGFEEIEAARPHSKICVLFLESNKVEVIHEEKRWIGHVNASPTQSHLLTFCHEGPWDNVDHRIWAMDIRSKKVWKIRGGYPHQYAGHEYWHADGIHIGYHGYTDSLKKKDGKFLGYIRYDNTDKNECHFPYQNMHIHSNDSTLIVGDGQQASAYHGEAYQDCIFLWKQIAGKMEGPRILCKHRGSFHTQKVHVHPRFSPDGSKVLFTSDRSGYGDVYLVDIPSFEDLPLA
ncbi:oligogalacturonate lyase family protein [Salipaludibacillus sp. HK11]|uniref:oligogalacturonate lyase family protein n=1 Tax=Salipaludibacillus sp. HK11 TaxID=3394320 RepID=UPI0039FC0172